MQESHKGYWERNYFYIQCMLLTLSNSANSSSSAGLTGSFRNLANSAMVIRPPLQELAMAAKPSSSFLTLSHFSLSEQVTMTHLKKQNKQKKTNNNNNDNFQALFFNLNFPAWRHQVYVRELFLLEFAANFGELNQTGLHWQC